MDNFITVTVSRDNAAKDEINKAKEDFYTEYSYLKPECEKDFVEKVVDTVESAADWCCDHWEVIAAIAAVIVVAVVVCVLLGPEALVPLVLNIAKGVLQGALLGGALGGAFSAFMGGDIVKGIKEGALAGGALGALGAVGSACGCIIGCESAFGIVSGSIGRLTGGIATAMFDFDIVSMIGYKIDGENNKIYQINKECHSNQIYNFFQRGITAIAAFTGGMSSAMKCFIAGTVIATETGFARIESIKPGDIVLSTNADTMETGCKKVLEKYVRKTRELVHIIVGGKEIVSTLDHPYYVAGRGFVNACQLCIGSPLLDADGKVLEVEQIYKEQLGKNEEVTVYNFQVEDWHTYHVGELEVLVHNAEYKSGSKGGLDTSIKNIDEFIGGNKSFDDVLDDYAKVYADKINSNQAWSWDDTIPGGENLTKKQRSIIKQQAIDAGLITDIKVTKVEGMRYGFADFESAGVVKETQYLPENMWKMSDAEQFKWLDEQIGGTVDGYTWHHTEIPGKMQLVPTGIHNITTHNGGRTAGMWADAPR